MFKLRKSNFTKFLCLILAFSLFYISCSTEYVSSQTGCSQIVIGEIDSNAIVDGFEKMLDYARSVDQQEDYTTYAEFHKTLYGESEQATAYVNAFESESSKYVTLGFEGYVNDDNHLSGELKSYLINYSQNLLSFLNTSHPDLPTFTQYLIGQKTAVETSNMCSEDKDLMSLYLSASQGYANWYYKHYSYNNSVQTEGNVELRGCNFFEAIGCGLLALIVGAIVFVVAGVVVLLASIIFTDSDGNSTRVTGDDQINLAALAGFALGIYVGIKIYKWCCGRDEVPEQECFAPTGSSYIQTDCNQFVYRIFGPSNYGATEWGPQECQNENTNPLSAITPTPRFQFSVPAFGDPSTICARVSCLSNGTTVEIFEWGPETMTFVSDVDYFPMLWVNAPPQTFTYQSYTNIPDGDIVFENLIYASVNTPSTDVMTYNWTINNPHIIVSGGGSNDNFATIKLTTPNIDLTTLVTATNTCLIETESLLVKTIIQ